MLQLPFVGTRFRENLDIKGICVQILIKFMKQSTGKGTQSHRKIDRPQEVNTFKKKVMGKHEVIIRLLD